jgi:hypothetical protein
MFVYLTNHMGIGLFLMPLHAIIIMALKLKNKIGMVAFVTNLMKDDMVVALELCMLTFNN